MSENLKLKFKLVNALEKVLPDTEPANDFEDVILSGLYGETVSFQVAYRLQERDEEKVTLTIESDLKPYIRLRQVALVPSEYAAHVTADEYYLRTTPGMYPDLLQDLESDTFDLVRGQWRSLWVDVDLTDQMSEGLHPVLLKIKVDSNGQEITLEKTIEVIAKRLLPLPIKRTEWFHGDCIADYYGQEVFSEQHWDMLEKFIATAVSRDCNMILTPIFTPPLDTQVGGERTTIQLVGVEYVDGNYRFDFRKFNRWVKMCLDQGMRYFEMAHLFTQWGAEYAPKIMGTKDGIYQKLFGWETLALDPEYQKFLEQFLPLLVYQCQALGIKDKTYFHISDEPSQDHLESYKAAVNSVKPYLQGMHMLDALSDYEFYEYGLVEEPVCATNHIEAFVENQVQPLWSYYCNAQDQEVSNRFYVMPGSRTRVYGLQAYKYGVEGVLHWGYNFYNSQYSLKHINPYLVTDAGKAFPSGDSFLVYPGENGPEESMILMLMYQAMTDLRACYMLEDKIGKEGVLKILEEGLDEPLTFKRYPRSAEYLLRVRARINQALKER